MRCIWIWTCSWYVIKSKIRIWSRDQLHVHIPMQLKKRYVFSSDWGLGRGAQCVSPGSAFEQSESCLKLKKFIFLRPEVFKLTLLYGGWSVVLDIIDNKNKNFSSSWHIGGLQFWDSILYFLFTNKEICSQKSIFKMLTCWYFGVMKLI